MDLGIFSDFTIRNVMLGAALLGVSSGVLGSFAVLRQQSLLGDMLAHAALPGVCLGFLVSGTRQLLPILAGALLTGAAAALLMLLLIRRSRLKTDAALGAALSLFFALGVVLLTYIGNQNNAGQAGLESFLFGQAAAIVPSDVQIMAVITLVSVGVIALFWKELKAITFDPGFAGSLGFPVLALDMLVIVTVALAVVIGLQLVGVVLMTAMVIAPAAAARQWVNTLEHMVLLAALFGAASGVTGALVSAAGRGLATGPVIVICISLVVALSLLVAPGRGLVWAWLASRRNRLNLRKGQVLTDLYKLAQRHEDPYYPAELGMVNTYYGFSAKRVLRTLEREGLITQTEHMPEEAAHWRLTDRGYAQARQTLASMGAQ